MYYVILIGTDAYNSLHKAELVTSELISMY